MPFSVLYFIWILFAQGISFPNSENKENNCKEAFEFTYGEYEIVNQIKICIDSMQVPKAYMADINMPVCEDTLCANLVLRVFWDLAGNYFGFDTITAYPLTKFDHLKFTSEDYKKMDEIVRNRNSMLRILNKEDLIDKSVKVKSKTVDAFTGATPATIKKSVVEGAVYSTFTLWHFINGAIKNLISNYTLDIYNDEIAKRMLLSSNFETQLFALKQLAEEDFETHFDLILSVLQNSVPLVKANTIIKTPLPFDEIDKNEKMLSLFSILDNYSKSIFLNRILTEREVATVFIPLIMNNPAGFTSEQIEKIEEIRKKFNIGN